MGALMQIAGKPALFAEVRRVLRPGGAFTANDLLRPDDGPPPAALADFVATAGLIYHWSSLATTRGALDGAGFTDVAIDDRGAWYRDQLRGDVARLEAGPTSAQMRAAFGDDGRDAWIDLWWRLEALVASGELCPVHLRAIRPGRRTAVRRFPGTSR
jgi:phosphoethanolamine N-methyltransferase